MSLADADKLLSAINHGFQTLAILVGGVFGYYKFVKGRTFQPRGDTRLTAETVDLEGTTFVEAVVSFTNTGLSRVNLDPVLTEVVVEYLPARRLRDTADDGWRRTAGRPLLAEGAKIGVEPGETDFMECVMPLPEETVPWEPVAFRLIATVVAPPRGLRRPEATVWTRYQLLSSPTSSTSDDATAGSR